MSGDWGTGHGSDGPEGQKGWFSVNMEAGRVKSPNIYFTTITTAGKIPPRPGSDSSVPSPFPSSYSLSGHRVEEQVTLLPRHPRGAQRKWSPEHVLEPLAPTPPLGSRCRSPRGGWDKPKRGRRSIQHPEVQRPRTVERRPARKSRKEPLHPEPTTVPGRSPGPRPGGAASPASRTSPARRARVRSASEGPAPPGPPSCADVTRSPPTRPSSLLSRAGLWPMGKQGRDGWTAARERQKASGVQLRPCSPEAALPPGPARLKGWRASLLHAPLGPKGPSPAPAAVPAQR